jgi:hypothetical protein
MATIVNQRDILLTATVPRMLNVSSNYISLNSATNSFYTNYSGTQPSQILVKANLSGELKGTVSWSTSPSVPSTVDGNYITIPATSVQTGSTVTITATLELYGQRYTNSLILSNSSDTVSSALSTSSVQVPTAADGTEGVYTGATSTMSVIIGSTDNSVAWSYAWTVPSGVTATGANTRTISVTNMIDSLDTATLTCTATKTCWPTQIKTFTVSKSKAGVKGLGVSLIDIDGLGTFYKNSGGTVIPSARTLAAVVTNVTNATYAWNITGAIPSSSTQSQVTITPTGTSTITVQLVVGGANLTTPLSVTRSMSVVEQGIPGQVGQNGFMSAYPAIYRWTSGSAPARPTSSTIYYWNTGGYSAPAFWDIEAPTNTTPGWVLWSITVPLNVESTPTTTQSTLDWTNSLYSIRAISANGVKGDQGNPGNPGDPGNPGTPGSATYLINRGGANDSSQPTDSEVYNATGFRYAQLGDIATILYNSGNNSTAYRATTSGYSASWALQVTYITGSLIVEKSITANKLTGGTFQSTDSNFDVILGSSGYADGLGASYSVGQVNKRLGQAGPTIGPALMADDISTNPNTYAFYAYSAKGGAAKFQGGPGNGTNTVYISGTRADAIFINAGNGSHTSSGLNIENMTSTYGVRIWNSNQFATSHVTGLFVKGRMSDACISADNYNTAANTCAAVFKSAGSAPTVIITAGTGAGLLVNGDTYATGNVTAYYSSDITLKTNIVPLTNALEKLKTLGGYSYDWKDSVIAKKGGEDGYFVKKHDVGIIAQEVQKILPQSVATKPDGTLGVQYEKLIPLIIEAIKELDRKIK